MLYLITFFLLLILLFFLSKWLTKEIFSLMKVFIKKETIIFSLLSLIYLPGTIIHEMSHFLAALLLFLKVREVKIFPEFVSSDKNHHQYTIKLGSVSYEKRDLIRGILVGIAPLLGGILFFYLIFHLFPSGNFIQNSLFIYLIFSVSSTMFSSKKDLSDLVFIVPITIIIAGIVYIFRIDFQFLIKDKRIIDNMIDFMKEINWYFFLSVIINTSLLLMVKVAKTIIRR